MHHVDKRNIIQFITMISPAQRVAIFDHVQIITMQTLGGVGSMHKNFTYYAGIILDAFLYLLCSKLCQHNWHRPKLYEQS